MARIIYVHVQTLSFTVHTILGNFSAASLRLFLFLLHGATKRGEWGHSPSWPLGADGPTTEQKGVIGVGGVGPRTGASRRLPGRSPGGRTPERPLGDSRGMREPSPGQPFPPPRPPSLQQKSETPEAATLVPLRGALMSNAGDLYPVFTENDVKSKEA